MISKATKLLVLGVVSAFWTSAIVAQSATNYNFTFSPNAAVPDGNPNGLALATNLTGLAGSIAKLTVSLDISGGYNGDLYAYLRGPEGGFAVLLNRPGVTSGNASGYSDTGINVTLDDSANHNNIHFYKNFGYALNLSGQLTGIWSSDGRAINPQSAPSVFDMTPPTALLNSFNGANPDGTWTLFLADLSSGGQSTIVEWSLNIETVPEPSACALLVIGVFLAVRKRINRSL